MLIPTLVDFAMSGAMAAGFACGSSALKMGKSAQKADFPHLTTIFGELCNLIIGLRGFYASFISSF